MQTSLVCLDQPIHCQEVHLEMCKVLYGIPSTFLDPQHSKMLVQLLENHALKMEDLQKPVLPFLFLYNYQLECLGCCETNGNKLLIGNHQTLLLSQERSLNLTEVSHFQD